MVGSDAGRDGPRYAGTETGDAWGVKLSYVETRQSTRERRKGYERVSPPGLYWVEFGKGQIGNKKNSYVTIRRLGP